MDFWRGARSERATAMCLGRVSAANALFRSVTRVLKGCFVGDVMMVFLSIEF